MKKKKEEANTGKKTAGVGAVSFVVFTIGAGDPVAAALTAGAVGGAIAFDQTEQKADDEVQKCQNRVANAKEKICKNEKN